MGITIATPNRRLVIKTDDQESEELFNRIALQLLGIDQQADSVSADTTDCMPVVPAELPEEAPETEHHSGHSTQSPEQEAGYSGFLYVECEHCETARGLCVRDKLSYYKCGKCGGKTELKDMVKLYLNCECGNHSTYLTNLTDEAFDVNCVNCGAPVPVKYNAKKKCYQTIEG